MRVLFYATTFGADVLAFAHYLAKHNLAKVKVISPHASLVQEQAVFKLWNLDLAIEERSVSKTMGFLSDFKPDLTILDNHLPLVKTSGKALVLWHGYGWKGPNDEHELRWLHRNFSATWGSIKQENANVRWNCFGPIDFEHRTQVSGIHPKNCWTLGSVAHDYLIHPLEKSQAQPFYPFSLEKKTILFAPTWHYGEVFAHWGNDEQLFKRLCREVGDNNANLIIRMHDSFRFSKKYVAFIRSLERDFGHVFVKFKDEHPDNFLDLQISDVLLTNYSSIANLFYATGKPTVHIYPVKSADESFMWRSHTLLGLQIKEMENAHFVWKYPPEDHGGWLAHSFDDLSSQLTVSLNQPESCRAQSQDYLDKHMLGAKGKNCAAMYASIREWIKGNPKNRIQQETLDHEHEKNYSH